MTSGYGLLLFFLFVFRKDKGKKG